MQLFHGSDRPIEHPEIRDTNRYLDFGIGFYTTSNEAQALRWAARVRMRNSSENEVLSISFYATLKLFETGLLDIEETVRRLKTEKLCGQILFHTGKALEFCSFIESKTQRGQHHAV